LVNCKTVQKLLPLSCGKDLPLWRSILVRIHLHSCHECSLSLSELKKTKLAVADVLRKQEVKIFDRGLWTEILYRLPAEIVPSQESFHPEKIQQSLWRGFAWTATAVAVIAILLIGTIRESALDNTGIMFSKSQAEHVVYPIIEKVDMKGVTVMTFETDDPDVKIVWFFSETIS